MPRSKSVLKRERQNEVRRQRNQSVRSELKTLQKKARTAVASGGDSADAVKQAQRRLAKAATKGVIHKNKAARTTSRLAKTAANKTA